MFKYQFLKISFYLSRFRFHKIVNLLLLKISFQLSIIVKKPILWGNPAFLSIEPTNVCNLHCPECPTGGGFSNVNKGFASKALIDAVLPSIKRSILHVNLFFQGEPFLNKNVVSFALQMSPYTFVTISTNGHFITNENAQDVVKAGFYKIIVSLDGINQEQYSKYRKGGEFLKVIDAIDSLVAAKEQLKSPFPIIEIQCLLFKHTEPIKDQFEDLAKKLKVDSLQFKTAQFYDEENAKEMMPSEENSRYFIKENKVVINHTVTNRCWRLWSSAVITWNGDIVPCCFDKDKKYVQGNLFSTQLFDAWKHSIYQNFRKQIITARKAVEMCNNCSEK